ncbi:DUF423 domain-containing protein [Zhouia sp. PK063]|uniref:DUF423 domain-containing protein n=1 Tax=Zhouia sp. PK063 TaxID=3373602 RepID=UPI0037B96219
MNKTILITGTVLGLLGIMLGAFGAHGLKSIVDASSVATFEVGVRYQMYHAFFMFVLALIPNLKKQKASYWLVLIGVVLFSGSIYLLAVNSITAFDFRVIGFVTPIGGLLMILGWFVLLFDVARKKV